MKFVVNFMLMKDDLGHDFPDRESADEAPLAAALFDEFDFIERVFYMKNFVTVSKTDAHDWVEARPLISKFIKEYLEKDLPLLKEKESEEPGSSNEVTEDSEIIAKIEQVLEEYIKPAVEMDGGAITLDSYKAGVVKVLLQGSCSGCPSSTITLKAGIESLLKRAIPEIETVEAQDV